MRRPRSSTKRGSDDYRRTLSKASTLAGERIVATLTRAPGNDAPIGGLKVVAANGWFAARPSGTEAIYKIYAESFRDQPHLDAIVAEAKLIVADALQSGPPAKIAQYRQ